MTNCDGPAPSTANQFSTDRGSMLATKNRILRDSQGETVKVLCVEDCANQSAMRHALTLNS
jgi:hypothetical protein